MIGGKRRRRRATIVMHSYIGYGSYVINLKRTFETDESLKNRCDRDDIHFVISGWPKITYLDGNEVEYAK